MKLFSDKRAMALFGAVNTLANREIFRCTHEITAQDLFDVFVKDAHKDMLRDVMKIAQIDEYQQSFYYTQDVPHDFGVFRTRVLFNINAGQEFKFLLPKYAKKGPITTKGEAYDKIMDYIQRRADIGIRWGRVKDVLDVCAIKCSSVAELRHVFPGLVTLLKQDEYTEKYGEQVRGMKATSIPALDAELRTAARMATGQVTAAMLLDAVTEPAVPASHVQCTVSNAAESTLSDWVRGYSAFV